MVLAGYTIVNDVTARTLQKSDLDKKNPWFRSKSLDTFCPIGPYLIPADAMEDPHHLEIRLLINGELRQQGNTELMLFKVPDIIAEISRYMTLQSGDIIATGTPEGVGYARTPQWLLQPGDTVEVEIEKLGTLTTPVGDLSLRSRA